MSSGLVPKNIGGGSTVKNKPQAGHVSIHMHANSKSTNCPPGTVTLTIQWNYQPALSLPDPPMREEGKGRNQEHKCTFRS